MNTSNNDSQNEFDEEENSKYQPPKSVPITEIMSKDVEDASLNKYKQQLIGDAINVIIGKLFYLEYKVPKLLIHFYLRTK
jgi:hypothetical protein